MFSEDDLRAGYHEIRMCLAHEFLVMSFGPTNSRATFQCVINIILRPFLKRYMQDFYDIF